MASITRAFVAQRFGHAGFMRAVGVAGAARSFSHSDFETKRHPVPGDAEGLRRMIDEQVKSNKVMLYMKGTPSAPRCGFSQQVVRILHATGVEFASVNVLEDMSIREGVKQYSEWPTIPQLYVNGEFIGGCDIVTQTFQSGELEKILQDAGVLE